MRQALVRARGASGRTFPNPAVGAVVFSGRRILGRGATRPGGRPHAEVVALDAARVRYGARALRGASIAVTLEPCSHTGVSGPCVEQVLDAGIANVFVGVRDPNPRVNGRGLRKLRAAGLHVEIGLRERECREQHRGFLSVCAKGRPFVSLKLASSLDGRIATSTGESKWITGPEARRVGHRLRERSDAIMVGSGTALADDPALTARRGDRVVHRPVRIVADSKLRTPEGAALMRGAAGTTWMLCDRTAPAKRKRGLEAAGARILEVRRHAGGLDLVSALERLATEGLTTVLVEGGGRLAAGLLQAGLVDELHWFAAPVLLGGDGSAALGPLGIKRLAEAPALRDVRVTRVGKDWYWRARPEGSP